MKCVTTVREGRHCRPLPLITQAPSHSGPADIADCAEPKVRVFTPVLSTFFVLAIRAQRVVESYGYCTYDVRVQDTRTSYLVLVDEYKRRVQ